MRCWPRPSPGARWCRSRHGSWAMAAPGCGRSPSASPRVRPRAEAGSSAPAWSRDHVPVRRAQPVADAGLRQDVARALWIGLDLLAQRADIDPEILDVGVAAPDLPEDEAVGQHLA